VDQRAVPVSRPALTEIRKLAESFSARAGTSDLWSAADVLALALRALQESEGIIARLKAELDAFNDRSVQHCMERDLANVIVASRDDPEGSMIRTTDTGRELVMAGRQWRENQA
jgi:hypothetical protein